MRRLAAALLAAILLAAALMACSGASPDEAGDTSAPTSTATTALAPKTSSLDQRLDDAVAELDASGLSAIVALSDDGGPPLVRETQALRGDGVSPEATQIDLNSITKTVTAVMVLKLVDQGDVRLDETLGEIFASVPQDKQAITVHQLLTHSSGITDSVGDDAEPLGKEEFVSRAFDAALLSAPGAEYHYSNVGFSVLAAIVEERSGKPYDEFLRDDVLAGSGVEDLGYLSAYDDERSIQSDDGQSIRQASWGQDEPYWNLVGNGGLVSTATDFIRFRQAVASGRIISRALVDQSQTPHVAEDPLGTSHYGYGLVVQEVPDLGTTYWHDGGNDIFSAEWTEYVDEGDIVFVAAVDSERGDAFSAISIVEEHVFGLTSN